MMLFDAAIKSGQLSQGDLAIVSYISQHPADVVHMTSRELADAAYVSPSTVVRLCKKLGYESFGDMKVHLAREQADEESYGHIDANFPQLRGASSAQVVSMISAMRRQSVRRTEQLLSGVRWDPILDSLERAGGVSVYAIGFSMDACHTFVRDLGRLGYRTRVVGEESDALEWAASCPRDEFSVMVSYGGSTTPTIAAARVLKSRGLESVAICAREDSELARNASWLIPVAHTEQRQAGDRIAHIQSTVAQEYALDCLYSLLFARNYMANAGRIASMLDRQGIHIHRDAQGEAHMETNGTYGPRWEGEDVKGW